MATTSRMMLPLVLFVLATIAGVVVAGGKGDSWFERRREKGEDCGYPPKSAPEYAPEYSPSSAPEAGAPAPAPPLFSCPASNCPTAALPECCINPGGGFGCTNFNFDNTCGGCRIECEPFAPKNCCNQKCVDVEIDPNNCGTCGNVCGKGSSCVNGVCTE